MTIETTTVPIDLNREYSAAEFARLEDDGNRYELIEGKLVMTSPPEDRHARISDKLLVEIEIFLRNNPGLGMIWSHAGFNIGKKPDGKDNIPEPDLGFIVAARLPSSDEDYLPYPDLAVEVWSRKSDLADSNKLRKAREKLQMYLEAGTRLAWGINPITQEIEVYRQGQTEPVKVLTINDELEGEDIIPGFKIPVRRLFQ
jgi:Uma2 family endonuclease